MPYDHLIYNETLMLEMALIALLLFFAVIAVMLFISLRDWRKNHPLLRPVADPVLIANAIEGIIATRSFYTGNTSYLLESRKAISDILSKNRVGLLMVRNAGNSSAIDIEFKTFGDYFVSDGPETKLTSLVQGETHCYMFYLPEDMVNDLMLYNVKVRYKNLNGRSFTTKFHAALSPEPIVKLDDSTELRVYLQM